ncbi:polyprenyl synthetase family protein [Patescibacteria group bacterium]
MGLQKSNNAAPTNKKVAKSTLGYYKKLVWPEIERYLKDPVFPKHFKVSAKHKPLEKYHWKIAREYPERKGKYVRPTLVMLVNAAMGGENKHTIKTAAAMQLSEEWILIHDDIEDDSELRRGKPCLHKQYGMELAVNVGDTLQAVMWKILTDNLELLGVDKTFAITDEFHKIILRTTLGQSVDIKWIKENKHNTTNEDWFFIADTKSSYYSISAPLRLGAILADANKEQLHLLADFGLQLGRGWQLIDDILDITSDFCGLKQRGNDIYEGKRTILLSHLLKNANGAKRDKVLKIVGKERKDKTNNEVEWVISLMEKHGSIDHAKKMAGRFRNNALEIFENDLKFLSRQPHRDNLRALTNFIFDRDH